MADLTQDILTDRTKYPDDMTIKFGDAEITVKQFRDGLMPKGDFTRASQQWAEKERGLISNVDQQTRALAQALAEKAALEDAGKGNGGRPPARPTGQFSVEELLADPVVGPILQAQQESQKKLDAFVQATTARFDQHEKAWTRTNFLRTIAELKKQDPDLDVEAFIKATQAHPVVSVEDNQLDLEAAYKLHNHDRLLDKAVKDAEARGIEKGKAAAKVPQIPFGRRSSGPAKPEGLPEDFGKVNEDTVLNDPEMLALLEGNQG